MSKIITHLAEEEVEVPSSDISGYCVVLFTPTYLKYLKLASKQEGCTKTFASKFLLTL
jgi:hypothetical protein